MAFYVTMYNKNLVTLSMNKLTNIVIPTYFQFIYVPYIESKFDIICNLTNM